MQQKWTLFVELSCHASQSCHVDKATLNRGLLVHGKLNFLLYATMKQRLDIIVDHMVEWIETSNFQWSMHDKISFDLYPQLLIRRTAPRIWTRDLSLCRMALNHTTKNWVFMFWRASLEVQMNHAEWKWTTRQGQVKMNHAKQSENATPNWSTQRGWVKLNHTAPPGEKTRRDHKYIRTAPRIWSPDLQYHETSINHALLPQSVSVMLDSG